MSDVERRDETILDGPSENVHVVNVDAGRVIAEWAIECPDAGRVFVAKFQHGCPPFNASELHQCNHPPLALFRARAFYGMGGSPRIKEGESAVFVGVKLNESLAADLNTAAQAQGRTKSLVIREALAQYLSREVAAS